MALWDLTSNTDGICASRFLARHFVGDDGVRFFRVCVLVVFVFFIFRVCLFLLSLFRSLSFSLALPRSSSLSLALTLDLPRSLLQSVNTLTHTPCLFTLFCVCANAVKLVSIYPKQTRLCVFVAPIPCNFLVVVCHFGAFGCALNVHVSSLKTRSRTCTTLIACFFSFALSGLHSLARWCLFAPIQHHQTGSNDLPHVDTFPARTHTHTICLSHLVVYFCKGLLQIFLWIYHNNTLAKWIIFGTESRFWLYAIDSTASAHTESAWRWSIREQHSIRVCVHSAMMCIVSSHPPVPRVQKSLSVAFLDAIVHRFTTGFKVHKF